VYQGDGMYQLFLDSLLTPKRILNHRNRSGWFAFLYLLVLSILVSISTFVFVFGYPDNSTITTESTSCSFEQGSLVCADSGLREYHFYGMSWYFLEADETIPSSISSESMVVHGMTLKFYTAGKMEFAFVIPATFQSLGFDTFFHYLINGMKVSIILQGILSNLFLLVMIALLTSISFSRLRMFIPYHKLFKLIIYGLTPIALLLTFFYLLRLPEWLLILMLLLGSRSNLILQRELYIQTGRYLHEQNPSSKPDVESDETEDEPSETENKPTDEE